MKIYELPFEILMEIFNYLTSYEDVALVNKLFYITACKVNDPNVHLTIDDSFFCGQWMSNMSSIIDSTRQISRLNIYSLGRDETEQRAVISIIKKFSKSMKYLKLKIFRLVDMTDFLYILSLIPNVEHLICDNLRLRKERKPSVDTMSNNGDLDLTRLKTLRCRGCFNKFSIVFYRLPVGVLQELDLHDFNFNAVTTLLRRQTNIKKLKLTDCDSDYDTTDIFDNLTLEALEFCYRRTDNYDLATILSKQTKLRSLSLHLAEVDNNLIDLVTNQCTELDTFSMGGPFSMPGNMSVAQIIQMKTLKNLTLLFKFTDDVGLSKSLSQVHNPRITALTIGYGIYEFDLIQSLARSVPNLKILKLDCCVYSMEADGFMRNFNFVEVLKIRRIVEVPLNDTDEITGDGYFNPKLKELIINGDFVDATRFLNKLIASYPNLRKFEIKWTSITAGQVTQILEGFTELESLKLSGATGFSTDQAFYKLPKK